MFLRLRGLSAEGQDSVTKRKISSTASKLASIAAAGAGAIALTGGKAEAATIISNILNVTIGFSSNSNPPAGRHTVASHVFNGLAGGPTFAFRAVSSSATQRQNHGLVSTVSHLFARFMQESGIGFVHSGNGLARFAAGAVYTAGMAIGNGLNVGRRSWNSNRIHTTFIRSGSTTTTSHFSHRNNGTNGLPSFADQYLLFRFQGTTREYGWVEASMSVTSSADTTASYGPNLTIIQYAFDNTGAVLAAGATASLPSPEPSTLDETGIAALILGAEGLRRWRLARKTA